MCLKVCSNRIENFEEKDIPRVTTDQSHQTSINVVVLLNWQKNIATHQLRCIECIIDIT